MSSAILLFWISKSLVLTIFAESRVRFPIVLLLMAFPAFTFTFVPFGQRNSFFWDMTSHHWLSATRHSVGNASGTVHPVMWRHVPAELIRRPHRCKNLKTCTLYRFGSRILWESVTKKSEDVRSGDSGGHSPFDVILPLHESMLRHDFKSIILRACSYKSK